jgi:outer membrane protein OmpA-like peptidoglycan-associated protein/predicted nuclease with TOPRIM domain
MTRHDSRAQRFVKTRLGPSLAALVGIASTVELAAMPIPVAGVQLPGPTLIQQSPGPHRDAQQPTGKPRPPSAGEGKPDSFIELHESLTAARGRLEELSRVAEAVAATGRLQQEVATLRQKNQQLRAELEAVRAERGELETAKQAAEAHGAELTKTVEQATAKAREIRELVAVRWQSEQRIAAADSARTEAEVRRSEMREGLQRAEQEKVRIGADLARVQGELATAKEQVAAAGQEHAQIDQRAAALDDERDDLRTRLADATARLGWSEAAKAQLESEVAELREAAGAAADDARQNLIAVESRLKELNEALAAIGPGSGLLETDPALLAESGTPSAGEQADNEGRTAAAPVENVAVVAAPSQVPEPGSADADLQGTKAASATRPGDGEGAHVDQRGILGGVPAVLTLADLPPEKRQHVQGLLADLHSKLDERGLITTVPGELRFAVNSDEVQAGAYATLAKVAELIRMYDNRQVLIIGHSDAMGDAAHNRQLSERRADLVKQIFVDDFELAADRLSTEGLGEARPIASNATPQGRRANRRVEVLILN